MDDITYDLEPELSPDEFVDILKRSSLAERRPANDPECIKAMLRHADLIVTARAASHLIGVSRALTDFSYCTYLSDLAVDTAYQRRGIGRELMRQTHCAAGTQTRLLLLAAPSAASYYPHVGLEQHNSCWMIPPRDADTPDPG